MQTKSAIEYRPAPYGLIATIPAATPVIEATNLPKDDQGHMQYWAEAWHGMTEQAVSWHENYGFLISAEDVEPDNDEKEAWGD